MCGIAGWLSFGQTEVGLGILDRMLDSIDHRGPDERGRHQVGGLSLGMTRLSINDIEGGSQPYFSEDRSVAAVFNGEIYNFLELRREMEALGHRFRSNTDGEVIVHLWEEYGREFVHRLNGMFAIALWDGRSLYLFRDRMGIKPLYYSHLGNVVYFASELKALVSVPDFPRRVCHQAVRSYLNLEYVPSPFSIFSEARKLSPGHFLRVSDQGVDTPCRYWQFPSFTADGEGDLDDWAERLRTLLTASVKRRLLSDVPLGVFLSGGLDSSSLTALMTELQPGNVQSFSIGFTEKTFDESSFSREVASDLGTQHHEQTLDPMTTLEVIEPLYRELDEPMADAALIPTYLLAKFARQRVTVALSGEGADELLGGYPTYLAHQLAQPFGHLPGPIIRLIQTMAGMLPTSRRYLSLDFKIKRFCSGLGLPDAQRHLTWMGSIPPTTTHEFLQHPQPPAIRWRENSHLPLVERIQELDFHSYLAEDLLVKLDRATMLTSLEGRVPFLDHELVEGMAKLPTAFKFRGMDAKRVLKQAMRDGLPDSVLKRNKKGFGIPIAEWLRGPLKFLLDEHLSPSFLEAQGLFRSEPITRMVGEHLEGRVDHRKPLWTLIVFQKWWQNYKPIL
jgi:asparagine synthase (glutamine-hydrolysing)